MRSSKSNPPIRCPCRSAWILNAMCLPHHLYVNLPSFTKLPPQLQATLLMTLNLLSTRARRHCPESTWKRNMLIPTRQAVQVSRHKSPSNRHVAASEKHIPTPKFQNFITRITKESDPSEHAGFIPAALQFKRSDSANKSVRLCSTPLLGGEVVCI